MTVIRTTSESDRRVLDLVYNYNLNLLLGFDNQDKINKMKQELERYITKIIILPYGAIGEYVKLQTPGACWTYQDGTSRIEMYGFANSPKQNLEFIPHEFSHELWHAIINYTNFKGIADYCRKHGYEHGLIPRLDKNGNPVFKTASAGVIVNIDQRNHQNQKTYGKMFQETLNDILATGSILAFDDYYRDRGVSLDTVFKRHYGEWKEASTGYSIFTSLTRLLIAAFSNNGSIGYDATARNGSSIINCRFTSSTGNLLYANTFLHNMIHNPLEVEAEFDKYLGAGAYEKIATKMDVIFEKQNNGFPNIFEQKAVIKEFMIIVSDFLNAKKAYLEQNKILTPQETRLIVANYNKIWNTLQREYSSYFTEGDLDELRKRAYANNQMPSNNGGISNK